MNDDMIRYDLIVQEALRDAVRKVMTDVSREGLPGEHHFFITFKTSAPGVQLSHRMRQEYPDEMTIVLQHQFWDMKVDDEHFEVGLSFRNVPEKLSIPFDALTGFADPSVQFALRFETDLADGEQSGSEIAGNDSSPGAGKPGALALQTDPSDPAYLAAQREQRDQARAKSKGAAKPAKGAGKNSGKTAGKKQPALTNAKDKGQSKGQDNETGAAAKDDTPVTDSENKVVSIDAFRKKT